MFVWRHADYYLNIIKKQSKDKLVFCAIILSVFGCFIILNFSFQFPNNQWNSHQFILNKPTSLLTPAQHNSPILFPYQYNIHMVWIGTNIFTEMFLASIDSIIRWSGPINDRVIYIHVIIEAQEILNNTLLTYRTTELDNQLAVFNITEKSNIHLILHTDFMRELIENNDLYLFDNNLVSLKSFVTQEHLSGIMGKPFYNAIEAAHFCGFLLAYVYSGLYIASNSLIINNLNPLIRLYGQTVFMSLNPDLEDIDCTDMRISSSIFRLEKNHKIGKQTLKNINHRLSETTPECFFSDSLQCNRWMLYYEGLVQSCLTQAVQTNCEEFIPPQLHTYPFIHSFNKSQLFPNHPDQYTVKTLPDLSMPIYKKPWYYSDYYYLVVSATYFKWMSNNNNNNLFSFGFPLNIYKTTQTELASILIVYLDLVNQLKLKQYLFKNEQEQPLFLKQLYSLSCYHRCNVTRIL